MTGSGEGPSIGQLQDLLLDSPDFTAFLLGLATLSASFLGSRDPILCAITVERDGSLMTVASSSDRARRLDETQIAVDDGPCLSALRTQQQVLVEDLAGDARYGAYAAAVASEGIRSVFAVPIPAAPARAALNCFARTLGVFDPATVAAVTAHAASISPTLRLALRLHAPVPYPGHLRPALESRAVIDAAVGLIMAQNRCGRDAAMTLLHTAALEGDQRIRDIALDILDRARAPGDGPAWAGE